MATKRYNVFKYAILVCFIALTASCGYRFSGGGELPGDFRRLAVETFKNRTGEIGIESIITNDITYELTRSGKITISGKKEADAVLAGVIRSARSSNISHISSHTTSERRITVTVNVELRDIAGNVLWSADGIAASDEYAVSGDKLVTEENKKSAVARLSGRLAQRIYYRMTDAF